MIQDLLLQPGDLTALLQARGLSALDGSELLSSDLMGATSHREPLDLEGLDSALATLAAPSFVISGCRGARRMPPWPFTLYRQNAGPTALLAPEGDGYARLRFPYSEGALMDWLAGPFRRFATPEIGWTEIPALTPSGLVVLLALVDLFRHRYPDLDPDWAETEPIIFGLPEVMACVTSAISGTDPSALWSGLTGLGLPRPPAISSEMVESLLYVFANEGYLAVDLTHPEPLFRFTDPFLGVPLSLAWWDLSLGLEARTGGKDGPLRVIQGLALWSFETLNDGRVSMKASSGQELEARMRTLIYGEPSIAVPPESQAQPEPPPYVCVSCGHALHAHAKFCGGCGTRVYRDRCHQCGHLLEVGAHFCPECGAKQ